jgi:Uma2 family endonuclease
VLQPVDEPQQRLSRAEYRAWSAAQSRGRFERHYGIVVVSEPERLAHNRLKAAAWLLLRQSIQANRLPCEAFTDGMTVEIGGDDDFEPDAVVRCGERLVNDDTTTVPDPIIVVEVLSPSTSATDRTEKLEKYFRLPSMQHYLIVWADRRRVVHHRRVGSSVETTVHTEGAITLDPPGMPFDVDALYAEAAA